VAYIEEGNEAVDLRQCRVRLTPPAT
jgi:hypothetical protein